MLWFPVLRRDTVLIPSQRERQEELEREKVKEAEAAARREKGRKEREEAARKAERARVEELQSQGDNPTPRSQPPAPTTPMTIKRFPDTPQPEPKKSTCSPSYYDLLLIMNWDRGYLRLLKEVMRERCQCHCSLHKIGTLYTIRKISIRNTTVTVHRVGL